MNYPLLPNPKIVSSLAGSFCLNADTCIAIPSEADEHSFFAARQLQDEIRLATHRDLPIVKSIAPPKSAILLVCGTQQAATFTTQPDLPQTPLADQAYSLAITPDGIVLYAITPRGLFYAVQTLRQLIRSRGQESLTAGLPAMAIHDWPALTYRGLMLDISRGKVPTLETLRNLVAELSHYKINVLQLYTEHTFQFPRHPKIGADCNSLSIQDVLELDACCRAHHIELIPNLQSFGHMHHALQILEYQHLAESDMLWSLSPAFEETYTLLDELYGDMLPAFTSAMLNANCDETYDLGTGASKSLAEEIGVGRIYLNHILRVRELAARYGRRIQAWGDILLHHPELIGEVPEDVTLLDWHYDASSEYPSTRAFGASGRAFWVCPGVSSWNSLFPRIYNANVNIRNLVRDGIAAGAEGMLNTDWGDYGHYQPLGLSWYGYIFGAAQGWSGGVTTDEEFEASFGPLFFGPSSEQILDVIHSLARTNTLAGIPQSNLSQTVLALFDEPLVGKTIESLPQETLREMLRLSQKALSTLESLPSGHSRERTLREMASVARLTAYAARKTALSQQIRQDLRASHLHVDDLRRHRLALHALDKELETLRAEFEALWMARARRSDIHITLGYYARLRARYQSAQVWLEKQEQALLAGEPVDVDFHNYDDGGHRVLWQA
jgi:hypothetical protein